MDDINQSNKNSLIDQQLTDAVNLHKMTTIKTNKPTNTDKTIKDTSKFVYPTLILLPLIIVVLTILASSLSVLSKIFLLILIILSILFYVLSIREYDIVSKFNSVFKRSVNKKI